MLNSYARLAACWLCLFAVVGMPVAAADPAVSYTHLDVYKRQALMRACQPARPCDT